MHRSTLLEANKKPRIGGRCGVLVFCVSTGSETPTAPALAALYEQQQIYRQYDVPLSGRNWAHSLLYSFVRVLHRVSAGATTKLA